MTTIAPSLSSSKIGLKKHKALLPAQPAQEPANPGPGPAPAKPAPEPDKEPENAQEIQVLLEQIKASGLLRKIGLKAYDFLNKRRKQRPLSDEEKEMLKEPFDDCEAKILEMLPEIIRKRIEKSGPLLDLLCAVAIIEVTRKMEAPAQPAQEPANPGPGPAPAKPAPEPEKADPFAQINPPSNLKVNLN